jgi:hypothetical protein
VPGTGWAGGFAAEAAAGEPGVDGADRADESGFVPLAHLPDAVGGVALVAHHGLDFVLLGGLGEGAGLPDVMRQRFLREDVLAALHGRHRGGEVRVVGRGDDDDVDVGGELVEHHAEVAELGNGGEVREFGLGLGDFAGVDVAHGHDGETGLTDVGEGDAAAADKRQIHAAGRGGAGFGDAEAREYESTRAEDS